LTPITAPTVETGSRTGAGSFVCLDCGFAVAVRLRDKMPECPGCGGSRFRRASLFEQPEESNTDTAEAPHLRPAPGAPDWLGPLHERLTELGAFLAFKDGGEVTLVPIPTGWMRIGRSRSADLRLDHPTVSRRHAIVVRAAEGRIRALDDRSLNGLYVNGDRVEWSPLSDGDELRIGRYSLYLVTR
jgi:hypothetical protein